MIPLGATAEEDRIVGRPAEVISNTGFPVGE